MTAAVERPQLELRGVKRRGPVRGAVLALNGSRSSELARTSAMAASMTDRCLLVAVDGGLKTCRRRRQKPDLFVGDADSVTRLPSGIETIVFETDKDFSDLAGALDVLERRGVQLVFVAGLLGGRLDHEWANILELASASRRFAGFVAQSARGTLLVTRHGCRVVTVSGRTVSLFALLAGATISLRGTRWELTRRRLSPGSRGLSNVTGNDLDLTVHRGVVALMFIPQPKA